MSPGISSPQKIPANADDVMNYYFWHGEDIQPEMNFAIEHRSEKF
jgi:hypothetical protein